MRKHPSEPPAPPAEPTYDLVALPQCWWSAIVAILNRLALGRGDPATIPAEWTDARLALARLHHLMRAIHGRAFSVREMQDLVVADQHVAAMVTRANADAGAGIVLPPVAPDRGYGVVRLLLGLVVREVGTWRFDKPDGSEEPVEPDEFVTLDQAASIVSMSKKTLERLFKTGAMPKPNRVGGRGRAHRWQWSLLRPWLATHFGHPLPERFPRRRRR